MSHEMLKQNIEALLFVAGRPLSFQALATAAQCKTQEVEDCIAALNKRYVTAHSGLQCVVVGQKVQLYTATACDELVSSFLQAEQKTELTKPSVETLTIIAYRGPIAKEELEHIRGVNCSLILRNLLMRGLVAESERGGSKYYEVTHEFLSHIGVGSVGELPEYETFHTHERIENVLAESAVASHSASKTVHVPVDEVSAE